MPSLMQKLSFKVPGIGKQTGAEFVGMIRVWFCSAPMADIPEGTLVNSQGRQPLEGGQAEPIKPREGRHQRTAAPHGAPLAKHLPLPGADAPGY